MGPLTIIYLLHNFHNSNSWIIRFFFLNPFSFELDKFDCIKFYLQTELWGCNLNCTESVQTQVACSLTLVMSKCFLSLPECVDGWTDGFLSADICVIYVTYFLCPQNQNVSTLHSSNPDYFSLYSSNSGAGLWPFASQE
jgi:hypothetical protein